jgi:virginiamycin B lyase
MVGSAPHRGVTTPRVRAAALGIAVVVATLVPASARAEAPQLTEFPLADGASPFGIALGSDGAMWFTARAIDSVGRIEADGTVGPWIGLELGADPTAIAAGTGGAVWFTEQGLNRIGRLTPNGELVEFPAPSDNAAVSGIAAGPDGAMWFTERSAHRIGRIDRDGTISEFPLPSTTPGPVGIASGPDGAMWFTEQRGNRIGRITMAGEVTEWPVPHEASLPAGIAAGSDGAMWFTMRAANRIGRISFTGDITTWPVPSAGSAPRAIVAGPDGSMWFTGPDTDVIGTVAADGTITEYRLPTVGASPFSIAAGPDGAVWFTEGNAHAIGRLGAPAAPRDDVAPTIEIDSPEDGSIVITGAAPHADFRCADEGGTGVATCVGTAADGSPVAATPGAHRFQVTASDGAGNTASASTSYLAFSSVDGSIAAGSHRSGTWATLELGLGARLPKNAAVLVAPGFPVSGRVDCAEPSVALDAPTEADVRLSTRQDRLVVRWRVDRAWRGTCRTITIRFAQPGWTGADATFAVAFP